MKSYRPHSGEQRFGAQKHTPEKARTRELYLSGSKTEQSLCSPNSSKVQIVQLVSNSALDAGPTDVVKAQNLFAPLLCSLGSWAPPEGRDSAFPKPCTHKSLCAVPQEQSTPVSFYPLPKIGTINILSPRQPKAYVHFTWPVWKLAGPTAFSWSGPSVLCESRHR